MLEAYETIRAQRDEFYMQIMTEAGVPSEQRQRVVDGRRGGESLRRGGEGRSDVGGGR